jgi:glycine/D-amino acid oxidase-like deaminating enzyme
VLVSPERVIRTIVGLRPFRSSGFVVRAEKLDSKTVIHNYGHGGAGITLSWGTAHLAVQLAEGIEGRDCAVIGCGVVGLSTARLLQQRGYNVHIYAKAIPPDTTSNVAGGQWDPVTVYDDGHTTPDFARQFAEAGEFAFRRYQSLAGPGAGYGVKWIRFYRLNNSGPRRPRRPESLYAPIDALFPDAKQLTPEENPFSVPYVHRSNSMLIEPAIYLNALLRDFHLDGGRITVREFAAKAELAALPEPLLFNCTGLGAKTLFNDSELTPIRGQLTFLLPQPEIDYMTVGPTDIYMFPRQDGILLGGSHDEGNSNMTIDPTITDRILRENAAVFNALK